MRVTRPLAGFLIVLILLAGLGLGGWKFMQIRAADEKSEQVLSVMYELIPDLGVDTGTSTGRGRDPLVALSIQNIDIVGCIEIPSIDLIAPVTAKGFEQAGFISVVSGSPVKGTFRLIGSREDVFHKIADAAPGDNVIFTDTDGVRYTYRVTTQFHIKDWDWDSVEQDLSLCYETTDDNTQFVLGCRETF